MTFKQKWNIIIIVRSEWNIDSKTVKINKSASKVVRKFDDLCRIHIPKEIRDRVGINSITEGDSMEIEVNEHGQIVLTKIDVK